MQQIVLVGLSGAGKTTVAHLVAQALGWRALDTDHLVEDRAGQTISDLFGREGEAAFRPLERAALTQALAEDRVVLATGGGMILDPSNRVQLQATFTVWLHAPVATLVERLAATADRPLLAGQPERTLNNMLTRRAPLYAAVADWVITTSALTPAEIADEIVRAYQRRQQALGAGETQVVTPGGSYAVRAGHGVWQELPQRLDQLVPHGRAWLVTDRAIEPLYAERIANLLSAHGREVQTYAFPAGEQYKTLDTMRGVVDWLLRNNVERGDVLVALGGGVVGDLAGFAAATVLRGIALIHLPTTVLAMVDSSIGGKTGVDHAVGKNLVGSFFQPRLVLADTSVLATLPAAERAAGWAEAIKHGVIGDAALFADLHQHAAAALALTETITGELIQRAAAYKVRIVSGDEREHGSRITLNYGHTLGHAVEAESGYTLRHGEAVAIGMMAAGTIAQRLGLFAAEALEEQRQALEAFELPTRIPARINQARLLERISSDKKVRAKRVRWVLPTQIGATTIRDDVALELVADVVRDVAE